MTWMTPATDTNEPERHRAEAEAGLSFGLTLSGAVHRWSPGSCSRRPRTVAAIGGRWSALLENVLVSDRHARNTMCSRPGRLLPSSRPRPIRARTGHLQARFRRPGAYTATLSGAVSAGSNPAGGTGQRHKFEHSDILERKAARPATCGNAQPFRTLRPIRARKADTGQKRGLLSRIR